MQKLELASDLGSKGPEHLNNLAFARLGYVQDSGEQRQLVRALDELEAALAQAPNLAPALLNRALIVERLSLSGKARETWSRWAQLERGEANKYKVGRRWASRPNFESWSEALSQIGDITAVGDSRQLEELIRIFPFDARQYAEVDLLEAWSEAYLEGRGGVRFLDQARDVGTALSEVTGNRSVGDAVAFIDELVASGQYRRVSRLARGHLDYSQGWRAYDQHNTAKARRKLASAVESLEGAGSTFAAAARLFSAATEYYENDYSSARRELTELRRRYNLDGYPSIQGQVSWLEGVMEFQENRYRPALATLTNALRVFETAQEFGYVGAVHNLLAMVWDRVGEPSRSWNERLAALALIPRMALPRRRYSTYFNAALSAMNQGMPRAALLFFEGALEAARSWGAPAAMAESLWRRSQLYHAQGDPEAALADLLEAQKYASNVPSIVLKRRLNAALLAQQGRGAIEREPRKAIKLLEQAVEEYRHIQSPDFSYDVFLDLAAAYRSVSDWDGEAASLLTGIELLESRRCGTEDDVFQASAFEVSRRLFEEIVAQKVDRGNGDAAFHYVERARSRTLLDRIRARANGPCGHLGAMPGPLGMPPDEVLIEYASLEDRLVIFVLKEDVLFMRVAPVTSHDLDRLVHSFVAEVRYEVGTAIPESARVLFDALLKPILDLLEPASLLVFVPDRVLYRLPFAALYDSLQRKFLVEMHASVVVPSAAIYRDLRFASEPRSPSESGLVVGNPAFDASFVPHLERLPGTEEVAHKVAALYSADLLLGESATVEAVVRILADAKIAHISAHATADPEVPWGAQLHLAPAYAGDPGLLTIPGIVELDLTNTELVVLAACSTAGGYRWAGEGVASFAHAFIAAGVPSVVAALWNVSESAAGEVSSRFHRHYSSGTGAAEALRQAQVELLGDSYSAALATWAGFQVIGRGDSVTTNL